MGDLTLHKPIWEAYFSRQKLHRRDYTIIPQKTFELAKKFVQVCHKSRTNFLAIQYFYKMVGGFLTTILTRELQTEQDCQSIMSQYLSISWQTQAWLVFVYGNKLCLEILKKLDFLPPRLKNINCHRDISSGTMPI